MALNSGNGNNIMCRFCDGEHYSDVCSVFKTLEQRRERVNTKNVYTLCLKGNHEVKKCNYTKSCFYCKKKKSYHQSLCPEKFGAIPVSSSQSAQNIRIERESKRKELPTKSATATSTTSLLAEHRKTSTLSYADTTIASSDIEHATLAVFDMGSEKTYVTQELVKNLN